MYLLQALKAIHQPRDWADVEAAKRRLAFEELLLLQLKLLLRREIDRTPAVRQIWWAPGSPSWT